jgi:hypothetical protein
MSRCRLTALALAGVVASGCSNTPRAEPAAAAAEPAPERIATRQGSSWDLVLPGPAIALASQGPEYGRRDAALQWEPPESSLSRQVGPPDHRPTLARYRRLYQPRDPFGYIYFAEPYGRPLR